jgi:hypothetical protein
MKTREEGVASSRAGAEVWMVEPEVVPQILSVLRLPQMAGAHGDLVEPDRKIARDSVGGGSAGCHDRTRGAVP